MAFLPVGVKYFTCRSWLFYLQKLSVLPADTSYFTCVCWTCFTEDVKLYFTSRSWVSIKAHWLMLQRLKELF